MDTREYSELFGSWEDTVYQKPAPAIMIIEENSAEQCIDITYIEPHADELMGKLLIDEYGNYADGTSYTMYFERS